MIPQSLVTLKEGALGAIYKFKEAKTVKETLDANRELQRQLWLQEKKLVNSKLIQI